MKVINLKIDGMHCGGCVRSVTNVVSRIPGVIQVIVSLENESAVITTDDTTTENAIITAIESIGYSAMRQ